MAKRISTVLLSIGCSALLFSGTAVAQEEFGDDDLMEDDGMGDEGMDEGMGDEDMVEPEGEGEAEAAAAAPGTAFQGWPQEMILRPNTLPKGAWSVGVDLRANKDFSGIGLAIGCPSPVLFVAVPCAQRPSLAYGLSDKLQLDLGYDFSLKDFEAKGGLTVGAAFNVIRDAQLEVTPAAQVGYSFLTEGITPLVAGADIQYNLSEKMAIVSPPQHLVVTLDPIDLGVGEISPVYLQLPVGFAYQATPMVYVETLTNLARIEISDVDSGFIFADFIPVNVTGFYSLNANMDIGAGLGLDFKADEIGDSLNWLVAFRYYGGMAGGGAPAPAAEM